MILIIDILYRNHLNTQNKLVEHFSYHRTYMYYAGDGVNAILDYEKYIK